LKRDERVVCWFEAICGNGKDGCYNLTLILGENLNDVPVCLIIDELENVATWGQDLAWYLNRRIERQRGFLVPLIGFCQRQHSRASQ
jgi:hypothetical protein